MHTPAWTFHHPVGKLLSGSLQGQVDVTQADRGLSSLRLEPGVDLPGSLLKVQWNDRLDNREAPPPSGEKSLWHTQVAEAYVRGRDLIGVYPQTPTWPYRSILYWGHDPAETFLDAEPGEGALAMLSVTVSVQTDLLDTCPRVSIGSQLEADEVLRWRLDETGDSSTERLTGCGPQVFNLSSTPTCLLWRLPGEQLTYVEMASTSDSRQLSVEHQPGAPGISRWDLFGDFLEKGVLRRARVRGALVPRAEDLRLTAACYAAWEACKLPLTT